MSTSIYDTFGNQTRRDISTGIVSNFLENSTIAFPIPEAAVELLSNIVDKPDAGINPQEYEATKGRLEQAGFNKVTAETLAIILIQAAKVQGVSPMEYFEVNEASIRFTADTYAAINNRRPAGNLIGVSSPVKNSNSNKRSLIKP